jgi:hypothetical protein
MIDGDLPEQRSGSSTLPVQYLPINRSSGTCIASAGDIQMAAVLPQQQYSIRVFREELWLSD